MCTGQENKVSSAIREKKNIVYRSSSLTVSANTFCALKKIVTNVTNLC